MLLLYIKETKKSTYPEARARYGEKHGGREKNAASTDGRIPENEPQLTQFYQKYLLYYMQKSSEKSRRRKRKADTDMGTRTEQDSVGELQIPEEAYYGVHSQRARINFDITGQRINPELIRSLIEIKKACALANNANKDLDDEKCAAVLQACDYILQGNLFDQFITDPIQGGAGTSANMNANEVIANKALEILGHKKGEYVFLHPNDHVNMSQSTNDVYPTAGKLAAIKLMEQMLPKLERLHASLLSKAVEFRDIIKMGRTQLQDAVPVSLGGSFKAFADALERDLHRLKAVEQELKVINLSGTAVGTGINATQSFHDHIIKYIREVTGVDFTLAENLVDATQNLDCFVAVSGTLKTCAVNLSKMCNDLRLLSSGPKDGLNEIVLPPRQNGSSIMPGKINPVIPEVVSQVAFSVIGNDMTITAAAEAGQLELNAFEPVLFYKLFESITTLGNAAKTLAENCVDGIKANKEVCLSYIERSAGVVTALCPPIGYSRSAEIAKAVLKSGKTVKQYLLDEKILPEEIIDEILDPAKLVHSIHN